MPGSPRAMAAIARVKPGLAAELKEKKISWGAPLFIRIFKEEMVLEVWLKQDRSFAHFKTYPICTIGGRGLGPKTAKGDGRAPEGFYYVGPAQMNPHSSYHLAFNLGYPNTYDRTRGRTGGSLMVHGRCVSIGCFAMGDRSIEEIYALADAALRFGQPFFRIHVFPFKMTEKKLNRYQNSRWYDFWCNLKQGYDLFNLSSVPPDVMVRQGRYSFEPRLTRPVEVMAAGK
jgi:murein L,D-transpeptidase YafK